MHFISSSLTSLYTTDHDVRRLGGFYGSHIGTWIQLEGLRLPVVSRVQGSVLKITEHKQRTLKDGNKVRTYRKIVFPHRNVPQQSRESNPSPLDQKPSGRTYIIIRNYFPSCFGNKSLDRDQSLHMLLDYLISKA